MNGPATVNLGGDPVFGDADRHVAAPVATLDQDPLFGANDHADIVRAVAKMRENARFSIGGIIVAALLAIVLLSYIAFLVMCFQAKPPGYSDLKELTEALLAPVVGIVGAVTGFYFGERQGERDRK